MKNNIGLLIRIAGSILSTILFILIIKGQDWNLVWQTVSQIPWYFLLLALLFTFSSYGFNVLRWCSLLWAQNVKVSYWNAVKISLGGSFASNFLPSTIGGDGFRMLAIQTYTKSKNLSIGSVVLDRIINMTAMALLMPVPLFLFGTAITRIFAWEGFSSLSTIVLPTSLKKLAEKFFPKILRALKTWSQQPSSFFQAFLYAWPSNLIPMAGTYILARALNMDVTYWQVIGVQTVSYFLSVIPISINGLGLREVAYTTLYTTLGASVEQASTLALVTRLITILSTLPGVLWLTTLLPQDEISRAEMFE